MKKDISLLAIHPGETVKECLKSMGISQYRLASDTQISRMSISRIVRGKQGINAHTALRFGKFFGNSPEFWMNLQVNYELTLERLKSSKKPPPPNQICTAIIYNS
jgi:addiction module HigA family antidote